MKIKTVMILQEVIKRIREEDLSGGAAKLTFFLLLSIFPLLIFFVEILRRIEYTNPDMLFMVTEFLPNEVSYFLKYIVEDISNVTAPSSLLSITLIATLWAASKGIMAIISVLNIAYNEEETRSFMYIRLISILYTIALLAIFVIAFTLIVLGQKLYIIFTNLFPLILELKFIINTSRYFLTILSIYIFFLLLYNVTPNRKISFKDASYGSIFATIGLVLLSSGFSIYVNNATSLSYMYGSLTSIIIFLMWLYFTCQIIMIGGLLNAVIKDCEN